MAERKPSPIYLDYNATTTIDKRVGDAMIPYITEHFGNPSSGHQFGRRAKEAVDKARQQVATMLGCEPSEVVFLSGGTESINYALRGAAHTQRERGLGNHIITSEIEHVAVLETCKLLETEGFSVTYLKVDEHGIVQPEGTFSEALTDETILCSIMHANNEIGTIEPIAQLAKLAKSRKSSILFHTDASQSIGKIPTNVNELDVDLLTIAGHKVYAPKGVGALYVREGVKLRKLIYGAHNHEAGQRAGTENVILVVGLGEACDIAHREQATTTKDLLEKRDLLLSVIKRTLGDDRHADVVKLNGHPEHRLPNTLNISFKNVDGGRLLDSLSSSIAASAGSACHSDEVRVSHVLKAIDLPLEYAMGTVRLSVGKPTSREEIEYCGELIGNTVLSMVKS